MSFLTAAELSVFTSNAASIVKASFARSDAVASWEVLLASGFDRIGLKPWDKDKMSAAGKIPKARIAIITKAVDELMLAFLNTDSRISANSEDTVFDVIGKKLDIGRINEVTETVMADFFKKCGKSVPGSIKTIQNELSKLLKKMGYSRKYIVKEEVTGEAAIAAWLESQEFDMDVATGGLKLYSDNIGQDVVLSQLGGIAELMSAVGELTAIGETGVTEAVLPMLNVRDVVMYVAALSAKELGEVLGVEGAEEFAEKIAGAFYPVA